MQLMPRPQVADYCKHLFSTHVLAAAMLSSAAILDAEMGGISPRDLAICSLRLHQMQPGFVQHCQQRMMLLAY